MSVAEINDVAERLTARANAALIRRLYADVYNGREIGALGSMVADDYTDHNPEIGNGRTALAAFLTRVFGFLPDMMFDVRRVVAEADLIVVHGLMRKNAADRGTAIAEFFRMADGLIVERWDVTMPLPEYADNGSSVV